MQKELKSFLVASALAGGALLYGSHALAQERNPGGFGITAGFHGDYQRLGLIWESPSLWQHTFSGGSRLDLVGQLGAAYWRSDSNLRPRNVWQFSAVPALRWTFSDAYYVEAGVGPTFFPRTNFADRELSTSLQFGSHVGVGMYISPSSQIDLSVTHFSNAGIKRPNPGLNLVQLRYIQRF